MFFAFHQKGNDLKKFVADELESLSFGMNFFREKCH